MVLGMPGLAAPPGIEIVLGEALPESGAPEPGKLNQPMGAGFDAAGAMYIVELDGGRVHKLDAAGAFSTIAGARGEGYEGDGGPAENATFDGLHNIAVTPAGDCYISDAWNHCVRKIDGKTGIISTIAGTGEAGFSGDGGAAREATFNYVMCVSLNPANDKLYVADLKNLRIRVIDLKTGRVDTVAGNGKKGVPEDGAKAASSPLVDPRAVAVDAKDNVYILERGGHALRVVTPDGLIRTVAGTGERGMGQGPALKSALGSPKHLCLDARGRVIIADDQNARICVYDPEAKTLTPILGAGADTPEARLDRPHGVTVEGGWLYVSDSWNHRILRMPWE